jgi:aminoglycoside phosphotransferase (APT) family kinase protein
MDPHLGNWYLDRDGRPGLLDWQSVRKGPWAHDFNYCVVSSVDMLDRRAWEQDLLRHYLDALRWRSISPPAFEEAWLAYRQQTVYGLYYWLVNPIEFQVEVNNCAVASRFAFAAIDHGTFDLLT